MSVILRPYQQKLEADIFDGWQQKRSDGKEGSTNVLAVAATGAGKTKVMSSIVKKINDPSVSFAHRQELVSQISLALAEDEIYHNIIAAEPVIRFCINRHIEETGKSFYHAKAPTAAAGVQTIIRRGDDLSQWLNSVRMWNMDEAHHGCPDNSWGKATVMLPNAWGVGFTASPLRADRKPLGRINGGLFDYMVQAPSMRELINAGYLCDYRLIAPTLSIDRTQIPVSEATGELNQKELRKEAHRSQIVGDAVQSYLNFVNGKQTIVFVVDIEQATEMASKFNAAGVKSTAVSGKTKDTIRQGAINDFRDKRIQVLINVDLFGEGFDVPGCEVVIMARPTESLGLYIQQFGRALRLMEGKIYGIIIDQVGNYIRHGLPDSKRTWSLEQDLRGTPRGGRDPDVLPMRRCLSCFHAYESITRFCPNCGFYDEPESRGSPEFVEGDLSEVDPEILAKMRGEITALETGVAKIPYGITDPMIIGAIHKNYKKRQEALTELRNTIDMWGGIETQVNDRTVNQAYSVFYHKYGVDTVSAQLMKTADMVKLTEKIRGEWV